MDIQLYLNALRQKGYLAYEYNPFYNYQTDTNLLIIDDKYLVPEGLAVNIKNGQILTKKTLEVEKISGQSTITENKDVWVDNQGNKVNEDSLIVATLSTKNQQNHKIELFAEAGSLVDLDTDKLNFDLEHPVEIEVQPSYDGSVNLILNDDKNIPRLINSRFSVREKNTYEIVDRIGENDTNIYNSKTFDKDTSLYFQYEYNPTIDYLGFIRGILPVGSYCFYFTYCDSDNNESDYIAETGLIPVFIGSDGDPNSIDGGIKNQVTNKGIRFRLNNIDRSYNYLKVYYVRYFADYQQNRVYECKKIDQRYPINSGTVYLQITGNETAEDLDANILNITRFNPKSILTQAQCKNMLFFGNIVKNSDNYRELQDCALRIMPYISKSKIGIVDNYYTSVDGNYGYYSSSNMYNKVGYFNNEYYRFGVVFIYKNGTLSNVYNTCGLTLTESSNHKYVDHSLFEKSRTNESIIFRKYIEIDDYGWIKNSNNFITGDNIRDLNGRGVCQLKVKEENDNTLLGIKFEIPEEVIKFLSEDLGIRGLFFVRQKCIPNILAQCYLMPMDSQLEAPVIEYKPDKNTTEYRTECFVSTQNGVVTNSYDSRLHIYNNDKSDAISENAYAAICPDFLLNQPYYNQIFNGSKFRIQDISTQELNINSGRMYSHEEETPIKYNYNESYQQVTICTVTDDVPTIALDKSIFRLEMGETEEAFRFRYAEIDSGTYDSGDEDFDAINKSYNIVRGKYSPYLAILSSKKLKTGHIYNIYQDGVLNTTQEYQTRMDSSEPFYAISDRYNFENLSSIEIESKDNTEIKSKFKALTCYRGDCYSNIFTYRLNRNFNDPSLPNNDEIIDKNTWKNNYKAEDPTKWPDISRSDINAVQMGSWITIKVKSAMNYALRSQDHSYVAEEALMGAPRSYYPRNKVMWRGENKMPDSYLYNDAYRASLGFKCYFTLQDVNYIKDNFSNRIQYSAMAIQDSYKNNYRYSLSTYFRDYSMEYGSITKLIEFNGYLLVVFEHGIGLAVVNERVLAGGGDGEPVFINTENVLPEELTIISNTYGTQWGDSVIKTESGNVYGVDTVAKKIWKIPSGSNGLEIISDFKVNKFLIDNISLGERELTPFIGLKNVKTHYNNNKKDIIFTFYDDVYRDEEKVWSLCYNELLDNGGQFVTFYSWIPSFSENIDTQFFTFNRNTAKQLSLLSKCNYNIPANKGVLVDYPILSEFTVKNEDESEITYKNSAKLYYKDNEGKLIKNVEFEVEWDHWGNYKLIDEDNLKEGILTIKTTDWEQLYNDYKSVNRQDLENAIKAYKQATTPDEKEHTKSIALEIYNKLRNLYEKILKEKVNLSIFSNTTPPSEIDDEITGNNTDWRFLDKTDADKEQYYFRDWILDETKWKNGTELFYNIKGGIILLYIKPKYENDRPLYSTSTSTYLQPETVAVAFDNILKNNLITPLDKLTQGLTTDFYLHGKSATFDITEDLYPCFWYQEQHPFEFEFIVNDKIGQQKIFTNLVIISNKAEPESFHFEIEGDNYDFSQDKRAMYFRQEATKNLYQNLGSDILYDRHYTDIVADKHTQEQYYRAKDSDYSKIDRVYPKYKENLVQQVKSTIFPLYYERTDTYNEIYHDYQLMHDETGVYDFQNLSGSEVSWNRDLNQFNIVTHIKNSPIPLVGRLRGNSYYKEGKWNIQIPSITFMQKNEEDWKSISKYPYQEQITKDGPLDRTSTIKVPPIVINSEYIPEDIKKSKITMDELPNIYTNKKYNIQDYIKVGDWTYRKETKIRDKWIKIRVRYSGKNLAIIHSLITLYNISYS